MTLYIILKPSLLIEITVTKMAFFTSKAAMRTNIYSKIQNQRQIYLFKSAIRIFMFVVLLSFLLTFIYPLHKTIYISSRPEVFCENGALKNFAKLRLRSSTLLQKRLRHRYISEHLF